MSCNSGWCLHDKDEGSGSWKGVASREEEEARGWGGGEGQPYGLTGGRGCGAEWEREWVRGNFERRESTKNFANERKGERLLCHIRGCSHLKSEGCFKSYILNIIWDIYILLVKYKASPHTKLFYLKFHSKLFLLQFQERSSPNFFFPRLSSSLPFLSLPSVTGCCPPLLPSPVENRPSWESSLSCILSNLHFRWSIDGGITRQETYEAFK